MGDVEVVTLEPPFDDPDDVSQAVGPVTCKNVDPAFDTRDGPQRCHSTMSDTSMG